MRNTNYSKYDKVVCIQWYGDKFKIGEVFSLNSDLMIKGRTGDSMLRANAYYKEFRKAYKNELKLK